MPENPYLVQVHAILPRLLALYDADPASPTRGMGDRYYWAWKLTDFGNGTFQGAVHGLSRLLVHDLLPESLSAGSVMNRIDEIFEGTDRLRRANGSLEEAFPYESSFCVTALVAYDLTTALHLLDDRLDVAARSRYREIIRPMIRYLLTAEETHGFITNHLATAAAALTKWSRLEGGEGGARGRALAARILEAQSGEGWFPEYEGADPGYQSLALYYLADLQACDPCPKLEEALRRAIAFLSHFAHPDGSFGGLYGSRNTRFFCPSGVEQLAFSDPVAAGLAAFMRESIAAGRTVVLDVLDAPNLVPMFNAYCWAAAILAEREGIAAPQPALIPAQSGDSWRKEFTEAGLLVDKGSRHYTIISWHKGGVCCHWEKGTPPFVDGGVLLRSEDGVEYSTQAYRPENSVEITEGSVIVEAPYSSVSRRRPTPENFALFRLLNVTIMRFSPVREWIKRRLVGMLITGCRTLPGSNCRKIQMGLGLTIEDQIPDAVTGRFERHSPGGFHAIHMAGQGYWQRQDDEL